MPVTKVLYVEDDEIVRRAIVNYMTTLGYSMLQAADGQAGLDLFREEAPDVILTDLRMPKMDGLQLLSVIKDEAPDTPVIIVSGMGTIDDAVKALTLGAWDYIIKPVSDMAILEHAVNKALERSNLVRENKQYQRHLEEEVEKRTAELLQAQKMEAIGTLASGVAHDFNNMLNAILGYTDLLLQDTPAESRQYTRIAEISKAGQRAAELVNQILAFSRQTRQEPIALHMQRLIKECLTLLHGSLPATIEINEQIDALCGAIYADPTQIHQVIMNLATNAYHAMREHGGRLGIELVQVELAWGDVPDLPPGPYARLRVTDSGHGIEPEIMQRIFDPYFSTKKSGEGTGLGLSTVHGII
ncbi:MAG: response regulator, partial [Desulfobulbaceae bacterium]|nr:response regulator [Desulfobulbaceae bacterium]